MRPSQGGTCSLVPLKYFSIFPFLQNQNLNFLCSLLPKITFVPLFPSFLDMFPCSSEINDFIPLFPITPLEGLINLDPHYKAIHYNAALYQAIASGCLLLYDFSILYTDLDKRGIIFSHLSSISVNSNSPLLCIPNIFTIRNLGNFGLLWQSRGLAKCMWQKHV